MASGYRLLIIVFSSLCLIVLLHITNIGASIRTTFFDFYHYDYINQSYSSDSNNKSTKHKTRNRIQTTHSQENVFNMSYLNCSRQISASMVPFIWENYRYRWYNIIESSTVNSQYLKHSPNLGSIMCEADTLNFLETSSSPYYRKLGKILRNNCTKCQEIFNVLNNPDSEGRTAIFKNVMLSSDGWIVKRLNGSYCLAVINGGCKSPISWKKSKFDLPTYHKVISIAMYWGEGTWHFVLESLVGLANIFDLKKNDAHIYVTQKNKLVIDWLRFVGIPPKKIISGSIIAEELIVPEMGRCGSPFRKQISWIRTIIPSKIPNHRPNIVLIKRTFSRVMQNFSQIFEVVKNFARSQTMKLVMHDDKSLPSIPIQLQYFANASIVIGPHGAGLINLIATKKGTCVIEFVPRNINICYMRLSYFLGLNYFAVPLKKDNIVDPILVRGTLKKCFHNFNNTL